MNTMENILELFGKVSDFKFIAEAEKHSLPLFELKGGKWEKLTTFKKGFKGYHKPIFLYEKIEGKMIPHAIGFYKKL